MDSFSVEQSRIISTKLVSLFAHETYSGSVADCAKDSQTVSVRLCGLCCKSYRATTKRYEAFQKGPQNYAVAYCMFI